MDWNLIIILLVIFVATLIRATFGFGDALFAMPILVVVTGIKTATPLMALVGFIIAITILISERKKVKFKSALWLIVFSLIGIPIGLFVLKGVKEELITLILGILIVLFSSYNLLKPRLLELKNDKLAWLFGLVAGTIGAAYNTNGPWIVIYGTLRKWNPQNFRATLQGYFFVTGIILIISHGIAGNFTGEVLTKYLYSLPIIFLAIFIGHRLNKRIPAGKFNNYIYLILCILGIFLIINTF
ncbi:sulfite exporter TauE/SafE family protein [Bacteroidota bacterium]